MCDLNVGLTTFAWLQVQAVQTLVQLSSSLTQASVYDTRSWVIKEVQGNYPETDT